MRSALKQVGLRRGSQDTVTHHDAAPDGRKRSISDDVTAPILFRMQNSATGNFLRKLRRKSRPSPLHFAMLANDEPIDSPKQNGSSDPLVNKEEMSPSSVYSGDNDFHESATGPINVADVQHKHDLTLKDEISGFIETENARPSSSSSSPSWVRLQKKHLSERPDDTRMPTSRFLDAGNPWIDSSPGPILNKLTWPLTCRSSDPHYSEVGLQDPGRRDSSPDHHLPVSTQASPLSSSWKQIAVHNTDGPTPCGHRPGLHPPTPTPWAVRQHDPDSIVSSHDTRSIALDPATATAPQQYSQSSNRSALSQTSAKLKSVVSRSSANTNTHTASRGSNSLSLRRISNMNGADLAALAREQGCALHIGDGSVSCFSRDADGAVVGDRPGTVGSLIHRNAVLNGAVAARDQSPTVGQWEYNLW